MAPEPPSLSAAATPGGGGRGGSDNGAAPRSTGTLVSGTQATSSTQRSEKEKEEEEVAATQKGAATTSTTLGVGEATGGGVGSGATGVPQGMSYAEAMEGSTRPLVHPDNPVVFLDISVGTHEAGRVKIELFKNVAPKCAENFRQFCTGEYRENQVPLGYKGSTFHRVIKDFMIQGGDFVKGDGTGCLSIYGSSFDDEPFVLPHFRSGLLSMANSGPNSNGCQFFVTCNKCSWLDGKHVVFGQVLGSDSMQVVRKVEHVTVDSNNKPRVPVAITQCGEL